MMTRLLPTQSGSRHGFTLIEVMLVISLWAILFAVSVASLSTLIPKANLDSYEATFLTALKSQQSRAQNSYAETSATGGEFGIFIESNRFTLFEGSSYNPAATNNVVEDVEAPVTISSSFASNLIIFQHLSGAIENFNPANNSITLSDTTTGQQTVIRLNQYGVITEAN